MIEAGKVDQIIDTVTDINELINPSMREDDPHYQETNAG